MNDEIKQQREVLQEWITSQMDAMAKYVYGKNLLKGDLNGECRWVYAQEVCIARFALKSDDAQAYWVIGGMVPHEALSFAAADSPRAAARQFAMKWQLQGARTVEMAGQYDGEVDYHDLAKRLVGYAEALYALTERDQYWTQDVVAPPEPSTDAG